jgi:23S rRNA pseudouridine2605 synthase
MDTTGLLLFMTDGELAHALLHPRHHVKKCYHAVVDGVFSNDAADKLRAGVMLDDGPTQPAEVRILRVPSGSGAALADLDRHHLRYDKKLNTNERVAAAKGRLRPARSEVAITICEGRKREVKRMCRAVGHPVIELDRVSFGPLTLNGLSCGKWRALCSDEVRALKEACGLS